MLPRTTRVGGGSQCPPSQSGAAGRHGAQQRWGPTTAATQAAVTVHRGSSQRRKAVHGSGTTGQGPRAGRDTYEPKGVVRWSTGEGTRG